MRAVPRSLEAVSEQTSYLLELVENSSQKAVASCWLAAGAAGGPVEELVGPMEVVAAIDAALNPKH